ncbi:hypothetical protein ACVQ92_06840 [Staphylococcus aureus]
MNLKTESQDLDFSIKENIRLAENEEGVSLKIILLKAFLEKGYQIL